MSKLLYTFFLCFTLSVFGQLQHSGVAYKGIQRAKDEAGNFWLVNAHDVKIASLDSIQLRSTEILDAIEKSGLQKNDVGLIKRIVLMYSREQDRLRELLNVANTYPDVDLVIMKQCHEKLLLIYGKRKLKKMLKRKD